MWRGVVHYFLPETCTMRSAVSYSIPSLGRHSRMSALMLILIFFAHSVSGSPAQAEKLGRSEYCGLCHTEIYQQWNASTHHFSSFNNPIYRKVILENVGKENREVLEFCANCHDPLLKMQGPTELDLASWQANSGITCLSCHRMADIQEKNGEYTIKEPFLHPFSLAESPILQWTHGALLELSPWLHREVLSDPQYRTPEFCATCHTLEVPERINGHGDLQLFSEYESWQTSAFARGDNQQPVQRCQDCHMPLVSAVDPAAKDGKIHDHSFAASHTILPLFNRDFDQLAKVESFLRRDIVKIFLQAVAVDGFIFSSPYEGLILGRESHLELDISVSNIGVGHHFPGGTADSNEAWLSFEWFDERGVLVGSQGAPLPDGRLPPDAIRFGSDFFDRHGRPTSRGTTTTQAVVRGKDSRIPPNSSVNVRVSLPGPQPRGSQFELKIRLNWRKYDPNFIAWVFDGRPIPEVPVTVLAEESIRFQFREQKKGRNQFR